MAEIVRQQKGIATSKNYLTGRIAFQPVFGEISDAGNDSVDDTTLNGTGVLVAQRGLSLP